MEEVLTIKIKIKNTREVVSPNGIVRMLSFEGRADSPYFRGMVMDGTDTQIQRRGDYNRLSARYILHGVDYTGQPCKIFVENNGEDTGIVITHPVIFTDSVALSFLETEPLVGHLTTKDGLTIHIQLDK
ncbi:MAG: DUF3237 domain-containing protein [Clostridia bacterium]|nr:DUF3237 domain-containing protein [Clostridia bacterium]